jgi:hypothetical protein
VDAKLQKNLKNMQAIALIFLKEFLIHGLNKFKIGVTDVSGII